MNILQIRRLETILSLMIVLCCLTVKEVTSKQSLSSKLKDIDKFFNNKLKLDKPKNNKKSNPISKMQRSLLQGKVIKKGNVNFIDKNGDISIHRELMIPGMPKRANDVKIHLGSAIGGLMSVKFPDVPAPVFIKQNPFYSFI